MAVILIVEDRADTRLARRIWRAWAGSSSPSASLPMVALTGDMRPDTLLRAEAAGFAAFLHKPANMDRLETVVRPLLEGTLHRAN